MNRSLEEKTWHAFCVALSLNFKSKMIVGVEPSFDREFSLPFSLKFGILGGSFCLMSADKEVPCLALLQYAFELINVESRASDFLNNKTSNHLSKGHLLPLLLEEHLICSHSRC